MPEYKAPIKDIRFVLNDVLNYPQHCQTIGAEGISEDLVSAVLEEAAKFAEEVIAPLKRSGDEEGCRWEDGRVVTPNGFKSAYDDYIAGGWTGLPHPTEYGGQGLPGSLGIVINEMLASANHAWMMYPSLSGGAVETIVSHGTEGQKALFLPKLISGEWSGTMCLTEAHCGSDLGLLRTKAKPAENGSYRISGSKIFISAGDHDLTENIIHLVLARLPDAPAGVSGISLFIVPKFKVLANGNLGLENGVTCGSIEHKMGINGNATCVLNFDDAEGFLIGKANKGMSCMFTFINESRLGVAVQGQAHMEASYQTALSYAKDRIQMRAPVRVLPESPADPIISHPDVRRMLLTQKAFAEGGRLLNYYCALQSDIARHSDNEAASHAGKLLALLTPIAKGFLTEVSLEATQNGVQILGGHGFIREWGQEQEYRDSRITAIYEGTNTIQGLDLLGRKILANGESVIAPFLDEIEVLCRVEMPANICRFTQMLVEAKELWVNIADEIRGRAADDLDAVGAAAYDFLMISGYTVLAYFWVRIAMVVTADIENGSKDERFCRAKLATAEFYFERLMPRIQSYAQSIRSGSSNLMALDAEDFC